MIRVKIKLEWKNKINLVVKPMNYNTLITGGKKKKHMW